MDSLIMRVGAVARDAQKILDLDLGIGNFAVDEVAIVCGDERMLEKVVADTEVMHGWKRFNSVPRDKMRRRMGLLRRQSFDVRFEFLQPSEVDYRIEAMTVLSGSAPLHSQHLIQYGDPSVVHASFKCKSLEEYDRVRVALHGMNALPFKAEYSNSYGVFSYWKCGHYFLKPRVNLRDSR